MKNYLNSVGMDISKKYFDAGLFFSGEHAKFANEKKGFDYVQEHALQIKRSIGFRRGKCDEADALDIARYTWVNRESTNLSKPPSRSILKLQQIKTTRELLVRQMVAIKNQIQALATIGDKNVSKMACRSLTCVLGTLERRIQNQFRNTSIGMVLPTKLHPRNFSLIIETPY